MNDERTTADDGVRRTRRRSALPLFTLLAAAAIFGWYRWTAPQRVDDVRLIAATLLGEAAPPSPARGPIAGTDPLLAPMVRSALAAARAEGELRSLLVTLEVAAGDHEVGDGTASHHAIVLVGDEPRVLLRVRHSGRSGVAIIGVGSLREPTG